MKKTITFISALMFSTLIQASASGTISFQGYVGDVSCNFYLKDNKTLVLDYSGSPNLVIFYNDGREESRTLPYSQSRTTQTINTVKDIGNISCM